MIRLPVALVAFLLLLPGCGEEPVPEEPETAAPAPAADAPLFASAAEEIVMKEAPASSVFAKAEAEKKAAAQASKESTAARGGEAEYQGGRTLTADQVKAVIKAKTPQVRACYERELKKHDGLRGKVVIGWTIRANGSVSGARAVQNTTRNQTMIPCMTRAVSDWRFPRAEASFDVEYPFKFKPRDW
ncbi:MAG: AgmX/PglI C-terminal domain-containing protein [Deltaproteobacteria bacterium]|nr:AgmX/PglI C-terminal domain-containing protein [Deltaproteobacteria bacterium]